MTPIPDLAAALARLEKENRNLLTRLENLEKQKGSTITALIANVILILCAVLLAGYLGLFPPGIARLPLQARTIETDEITLRYRDTTSEAHVFADSKGLHALDDAGKNLLGKP